jgi:dTDP-4-dehydrorhamnose 3,5-epimerase
LQYITLDRPEPLPGGARLRPLRVNRDPRGVLVETLRTDWPDLYGAALPFAQSYYSVTEPGVARDEDRWHLHQHQFDRFVVAVGCVVVALAMPSADRDEPVRLIPLGPPLGDARQAELLVPPGVLHAFVVIGSEPAVLLNSPTQLYDPADEGRVPFTEAGALLADGRPFHWDAVRGDAGLERGFTG